MNDQVETKKVKWEDLEVAEDQDHLVIDWREDTMRVLRDQVIRAYGLTPADLGTESIIEPAMESMGMEAMEKYVSGLSPAEANKRAIAIAKDAQKIETGLSSTMEALEKAVDGFTEFIRKFTQSVIAQIDAFWQAWNGYPRLREIWQAEVDQVQIEFERQELMRIVNEQIQRDLCWPRPMIPVPDTDVNRFRGLDEYHHELMQDGEPGSYDALMTGINLGEHTEEEMREFQIRWVNAMSRISAFCTPSRIRLTGR